MPYHLLLTRDAKIDRSEPDEYIANNDPVQNAERVLTQLLNAANSLVASPDRGSVPMEPRQLSLGEYRQTFSKPYVLIYRVHGNDIVIYLITAGRRDTETLLARGLLRSPD